MAQELSFAAYAAGILPFATYRGEVMFLVGRDAQDGTWSDFGGKCETRDNSPLDTAQREFYEETCGVVMELKTLKMRMNCTDTYHMLQSSTQSRHPYYMHLLEIPFDPGLRTQFRRTVSFLRFSKLPKALVEKGDVQWVTLTQLKRLSLRSIFAQTLRRHESTLVSLVAAGQLHA